jgi:hypothetical protein
MNEWAIHTTNALRGWHTALARFEDDMRQMPMGASDSRRVAALQRLTAARAEYRHLVLSWYWKLLTPMEIGACVPDEVATLLAEEWDAKTR